MNKERIAELEREIYDLELDMSETRDKTLRGYIKSQIKELYMELDNLKKK